MYYPLPAPLIEFLILSLVSRRDSYGYEISQKIKLVSSIKESTLYPILKKMEENNFLDTYKKEFQGRTRKYYVITKYGEEELEYLKREWEEYKNTIDRIIEEEVKDSE